MHNFGNKPTNSIAAEKSGFLMALALALGLHGLVLLIPMTIRTPDEDLVSERIELQLATVPQDRVVLPEPEQLPDEPIREAPVEPASEPLRSPEPKPVIGDRLSAIPDEPELPRLVPATRLREPGRDFEKMTPVEKARLTNTILSQPFISEESETDRIFGRSVQTPATEPRKDFHFPMKPNMMTMLDQPLPDLPFEYTPDLIYFAYDPGVRGDLQRFWDVITPEFGWRTSNGTEFKCKWILIITACGWK